MRAPRFFKVSFITCLLSVYGALTYAQLTVEVTQGVDDPTRIAVVPIKRLKQSNEDIAAIIGADLTRSGLFEVLPRADMLSLPHIAKDVYFRDWQALGIDYLLIGQEKNTDQAGLTRIEVQLFDVNLQRSIFKTVLVDRTASERAIAHKVSDSIYEQLTGIPGAFNTRMMYVSVERDVQGKSRYQLIIADADGARPRVALNSTEPVLSPSWSPDGKHIAYVSFESSRPAIYRQEIKTAKREKLTNFKGLNSAPVWSPDGRQLAMVLSKDGNPEIYVMDLSSKRLTRLTDHYAIDTEPTWMPDGKSLLFTSDRGGKPQIYQVTLRDKSVKRITYSGSYNAKASVLPDGKSIVMVHRSGGEYKIAWQELRTGRLMVLTSSSMDESPSLAPNGSMLLYATKYRGRGVLAAVSVDGGVKFRLPSPNSDVREPAWSPM